MHTVDLPIRAGSPCVLYSSATHGCSVPMNIWSGPLLNVVPCPNCGHGFRGTLVYHADRTIAGIQCDHCRYTIPIEEDHP